MPDLRHSHSYCLIQHPVLVVIWVSRVFSIRHDVILILGGTRLLSMAIRSAWWMRESTTGRTDGRSGHPTSSTALLNLKPHQKWPDQGSTGLAFKELERYLGENPGTHCSVHKLPYGHDVSTNRVKWGLERKATSSVELEILLLEQVSYLVTIMRF